MNMQTQWGRKLEQWAIPAVLILGIFLRAIVAWIYPQMVYPDEQFQVIEPANWVINGVGWKSWEWYHGVRSWLAPAVYMPGLLLLKIFGVTKGPWLLWICKQTSSLMYLGVLFCVNEILKARQVRWEVRALTLIFAQFMPNLALWSVTTFSENLTQFFLWIGFYLYQKQFTARDESKDSSWGIVAVGFVLGLSAAVRVQLLPVAFAVITMHWIFHKKLLEVKALAVGVLGAIVFAGCLDWLTWGAPFHSYITNVRMNIFEGVANMNGISPPSFYLERVVQDFSWPIILVLLGLFVQILRNKIDLTLRSVLLSVAILIAVHHLIGHKELRFIVPIYPVVPIIFGLGLSAMQLRRSVLIYLNILCIICGVLSVGIYKSLHHFENDLTQLSFDLTKHRQLSDKDCILFFGHYWIWTRGGMALGAVPEDIQITEGKIPENSKLCKAAFVLNQEVSFFEKQNEFSKFSPISSDDFGNKLYLNKEN